MERKTLPILLLVLIALAAYAGVTGGSFLFDDYYFISENKGIQTLADFGSFFTDISRTASQELRFDVYRPLTVISFAITFALAGLDPIFYHLVNNLLHAMNAVLVFLLMRRLFADNTKAFFVAAIFALHPIQTEAVSWSSGRGNVQSLFFMLLALIAYFRFNDISLKTPSGAARSLLHRASPYLSSFLLFVMAIFSKESAIVMPLLALAWLTIEGGEKRRRKIFLKHFVYLIPFFAVALLFVFIRTHLLGMVGQTGLHGGSLFTHALVAIQTTASYMKLAILPTGLTVVHIAPTLPSLCGPWTGISLSAIILVLFFAWRLCSRSICYPLGVAWFFIALLPAMNIVPIRAFVYERFLYVPIIGFAIAAVEGIFELSCKNRGRRKAVIALVLLLSAYFALTVDRNRDWAGPVELWSAALRENPVSGPAHYNLATELQKVGRKDEAIEHHLASMRYGGVSGMLAAISIAHHLRDRGDLAGATALNEQTMRLYPVSSHAFVNQAWIKMEEFGNYEEAEALLGRALKLAPDSFRVHEALARLYEETGRSKLADREREMMKNLDPNLGLTGRGN